MPPLNCSWRWETRIKVLQHPHSKYIVKLICSLLLVQYGQEVLTLGYPLGMDSLKLTEGIISGRQESYFQTDAPLNPGNSGGPMLNEDAKVIGINVAIVQQSQNVGFAIPSHHLSMLFESLKNRTEDARVVHKPLLGADFSNSSEVIYSYIGKHYSLKNQFFLALVCAVFQRMSRS